MAPVIVHRMLAPLAEVRRPAVAPANDVVRARVVHGAPFMQEILVLPIPLAIEGHFDPVIVHLQHASDAPFLVYLYRTFPMVALMHPVHRAQLTAWAVSQRLCGEGQPTGVSPDFPIRRHHGLAGVRANPAMLLHLHNVLPLRHLKHVSPSLLHAALFRRVALFRRIRLLSALVRHATPLRRALGDAGSLALCWHHHTAYGKYTHPFNACVLPALLLRSRRQASAACDLPAPNC